MADQFDRYELNVIIKHSRLNDSLSFEHFPMFNRHFKWLFNTVSLCKASSTSTVPYIVWWSDCTTRIAVPTQKATTRSLFIFPLENVYNNYENSKTECLPSFGIRRYIVTKSKIVLPLYIYGNQITDTWEHISVPFKPNRIIF